MGYGDGDEVTRVNSGPSGAHYATTWFRHAFEVADPATVGGLDLGVRRDDGAIVWLNGREVFRTNLPGGPVDYRTYTGSTTSSESRFYPAAVDPGILLPGRNVLAVEVHQAGPTSSDVSFDLWLTAQSRPRLHWLLVDGELLLFWDDDAWGLESASVVSGPWELVDGAENPIRIMLAGTQFFRLHRP